MTRYKNSSVSFTGHRPHKLGGYEENSEVIKQINSELRIKISEAIQLGYTTFISGMAIGVDTWAAEIVLEFKEKYSDIQLVCAVPFKGQEYRWPYKTQKRYWNIIDNADEIQIISSDGYDIKKMQIRNEWMVDNSNIVIAVWDGTNGGTGNCIKYAKKQKSEIWRIDPEELKLNL